MITEYDNMETTTELLFKYKVDINKEDTLQMTALDYALRQAKFKLANYLMSNGAKCGGLFKNTSPQKVFDLCYLLYQENKIIIGFPERDNSQINIISWFEENHPEIIQKSKLVY